MTTLSVTEARAQLLSLARDLGVKHGEGVEVTLRGKPVLAILPFELYEALMETMEVLSDPGQAELLRKSLRELRQGKAIPWEKAKKGLGL
ncbi:MAG: type II toxin-antitoxin system Phd/YefM family antitoxin [Elusimicrobia bacterium]|nr:type II toxin-antitoxin system Phd/YefM family antitoxin [Elusimicrobiota bacterium]